MGTPTPSQQYSRLSDEELFELLPPSDQEKYRPVSDSEEHAFEETKEAFLRHDVKELFDELWNRYYPPIATKVQVKLCQICPPEEPDRDGFAGECIRKAYTAFLRRTYRQNYKNFAGYLYTIFVSTAIARS